MCVWKTETDISEKRVRRVADKIYAKKVCFFNGREVKRLVFHILEKILHSVTEG